MEEVQCITQVPDNMQPFPQATSHRFYQRKEYYRYWNYQCCGKKVRIKRTYYLMGGEFWYPYCQSRSHTRIHIDCGDQSYSCTQWRYQEQHAFQVKFQQFRIKHEGYAAYKKGMKPHTYLHVEIFCYQKPDERNKHSYR